MKRVSRSKLYSCGFSVYPLTILQFTLYRREIALFLNNNQSMLYKSSIHSSRALHEILKAFTIHVDGRKEHALYHSNDSIIQSQSQKYLFVLSSSPDLEANTPSSSILFNPHPRNSIHSYAIPARRKQHQKMSTSPTVPFLFRYHHSQLSTIIFTLKSHAAQSIVIHSLFSIPLH